MLLNHIAGLELRTSQGVASLERGEGGLWGKGPFSVELLAVGWAMKIFIACENRSISLESLRIKWHGGAEPGSRVLGDAWERSYGELEWRCVSPDRAMPWFFAAVRNGKLEAAGVMAGAASFCHWQVSYEAVWLTLDLRCGGEGVLIGGRRLEAASVVPFESVAGASVHASLRSFMRRLCPKPILPFGPVFGFNDWYYAYGENSQEGILEDSELCAELSSGLRHRPFSVIDAGWQPGLGTSGGPWNCGNAKFPDMPGLLAGIEQRGCRPGVWFRPLRVASEIPGRMLPLARFGGARVDAPFILDPSIPENLELVREDVARFVSWGCKLLKHDFSAWDVFGAWGFEMGASVARDGWSFGDRSRTSAEIVSGLYSAIHEAAGSALLIGCNAFGHLIAGHAHIQRIGDDTSGREWARTRKMGVNCLAFRSVQHDAFFAVDADCAGITEDVPWRLNSQWLELLAGSGTPLFVSAKPSAMGSAQRLAVKEAFAIAASAPPLAEPLDLFDSACPAKWRICGETRSFDWSE